MTTPSTVGPDRGDPDGPHKLNRRRLLVAAGAGLAGLAGAAALGERLLWNSEHPPAGGTPPDRPTVGVPQLLWAPPELSEPRTFEVDDANSRVDGNGGDIIVRLPDRSISPLGGVTIENFRHLHLVGGEIDMPLHFNAATGVTTEREWPRMTRGFTGATGGTFRFKTSRTSREDTYTAPLPHDARAEQVRGAFEAVLGAGSVLSVEGDPAGGPWEIVPGLYDPRLGKVVLETDGLEGDISVIAEDTGWQDQLGLIIKNFTGTAHIEGLWLHGEGLAEGINVATPAAGAVVQIQNVRSEPAFYRYHNDHHHPDALQCYLGPAELRLHRVDLIQYGGGQAFIGQPRETDTPSELEALRDWHFYEVTFQSFPDTWTNRTPAGIPVYRDEDYPEAAENQLTSWQWRMRDCYAWAPSRRSLEKEQFWANWPHDAPAGLTEDDLPPELSFADPATGGCGLGYRTPGYRDDGPVSTVDRLA